MKEHTPEQSMGQGRNKKLYPKMQMQTNANGNNIPKFMGFNKTSSKREVHSYESLY